MCEFFSCVSNGKGTLYYFDDEIRTKIFKGKLIDKNDNIYIEDSHSSICNYYKIDEEKMNKYEFNPLNNKFKIDQLNNKIDDSIIVKEQLLKFDWGKIVPQLIIKPIINPLEIKNNKVTKKDILNLKQWYLVWKSVWKSVGDSVGDFIYNYFSSFFNIEFEFETKYGLELFDRGFVPSFDGTTWRLHKGKNAEIVFEISKEGLLNDN